MIAAERAILPTNAMHDAPTNTMQESAQFSAMATELSDRDTVGTALTLQMALGFSVTVAAIFAIPLVEVFEHTRRKSSWHSLERCKY